MMIHCKVQAWKWLLSVLAGCFVQEAGRLMLVQQYSGQSSIQPTYTALALYIDMRCVMAVVQRVCAPETLSLWRKVRLSWDYISPDSCNTFPGRYGRSLKLQIAILVCILLFGLRYIAVGSNLFGRQNDRSLKILEFFTVS